MAVISWTEIESFHNIRKYALANPEILNGESTVVYKAKIKLHGTNAAVQVHTDGQIIAQSRTTELSIENDNAGFAKWVIATCMLTPRVKPEDQPNYWKKAKGYVIFGEWIGRGIQKGVSCSEIPEKSFAVFAARSLDLEDNTLIVEPSELSNLLGDIPGLYILPWFNCLKPYEIMSGGDNCFFIDWTSSSDKLTHLINSINNHVLDVEANDPWIEETFGIKGTGEGLVFYPVSTAHLGVSNFNNLCFKAKGEKHKNIKNATPAQIDASVAGSIDQFVELVLTTARLEQGATAVAGSLVFDMKLIGKFLTWVENDVKKETRDELEASNLEWNQVSKPIQTKARAWYIERFKSL